MNISIWIALRYLRARHRHRFISFISVVSMIGIALGLTAVIVVMSVMNGFHTEIRDRILSMVSHINVTELTARLEDWHGLAEQLDGYEEVIASAPFIEAQGMLMYRSRVSGIGLRGILPDREIQASKVGANLTVGEFSQLAAGAWHIVLGEELAQYLGVRVGDSVTLVVPKAASTIAGMIPKTRRFKVSGIFRLDMHRFDRNMALVHLQDAARIMGMETAVTGLKVRTTDLFLAPWLANRMRQDLGNRFWVRDWSEIHQGFFQAVQMEKTMLFLLLMLIVLVAAFNIVSALLMTVLEKRADIAVLRTLGMTRRGVLRIFVLQGSLIGVLGAVLGILGGIALALNLKAVVGLIETLFEFKVFSPEVYYISEIPSLLLWSDVVLAAVVSLLLAVLAAIYPARKALDVMPAEVLRYE